MTSIRKGVPRLEICHVFADSIVVKEWIYCLFLWMEGVERSIKFSIFCGRHKCMIPNGMF